MAQITDYASLKENIASWLNRSDLTDQIPTFIQLAEQSFKRNPKVKGISSTTLTITSDAQAMPADLKQIESWYHDGPNYYGPISVVSAGDLGALKARLGDSGVPAYAAVVDGVARFAPEPSEDFDTKLVYWQKVTPLSDASATNWLLEDHPDAYLFGSLLQAAPFLDEDPRMATWGNLLGNVYDEIHRAATAAQFGGTLRRNPRAIGG